MKLKIEVEYDHDIDCPCEDGDGRWQVYSFNSRHSRFKHPNEFDNAKIKRKLKAGLAFMLSYYEHGLCRWSLQGEGSTCPWDSVGTAGIMVWEEPARNLGAKTYEERAKDARRAIEEYTEWCNGECYYLSIKKDDSDEESHFSSHYGMDSVIDSIKCELKAYPDDIEIEITGECADFVPTHEFEKAKV